MLTTLVNGLRGTLLQTLQEVVGQGRSSYALLDFPNHDNAGDTAIWVGERLALQQVLGRAPDVVASVDGFRLPHLKHRITCDLVFLHGGGNFGDLYPWHQDFRERVVRELPNARIIQLPQSVEFHDRSRLARSQEVLNGHGGVTILVRDKPSYAFTSEEFRCDVRLCPDAAFGIGPLAKPAAPSHDIVWLDREDKEKVADASHEGPYGPELLRRDWRDPAVNTVRAARRLDRLAHLLPWLVSSPRALRVYDAAARDRLDAAVSLLGSGRMVITDRLHGHILSLLLGLRHVILDTRGRKIRNFYDCWTSGSELVRVASTRQEALDIARRWQQEER